MLEHIPHWLGAALAGVRAGPEGLAIVRAGLAGDDRATIDLSSPAFAPGGRLPARFTADGEGVSPPLLWGDPPAGTASFALIVEDADAPTVRPLVHALVWHIPAGERRLAEGAIRADGDGAADGRDVGRNSYFVEGWLPPDPPTGHGRHDYVFQLFALGPGGEPGVTPGRAAFLDAIAGRVLAAGVLIGGYERGEAAADDRLAGGLAPA